MIDSTKTLPEDLYTEIQTIFRATPVVLIGSGFSCAFDLPHMGALGNHLAEQVEPRLSSPDAKALWASCLAEVKKNLEAGLNTISLGSQGRDEIVSILRECTAELLIQETSKAERNILAQAAPHELAPVRLLRMLFNGAPQNADSVSVITTNYDTLLELFCDLAELPLDTGFSGFRHRRPRIGSMFATQYSRHVGTPVRGTQAIEHRACKTVRLYKPHGSITWLKTPTGVVESLNDVGNASRAIVVPGPSKYQDALVSPVFDAMRTEMNRLIATAPAMFCMGFGFNDEHLQTVLKERIAKRMPAIIVTRDPTPNIEQLLGEHPHVIAVFKDGEGAVFRWNGNAFQCPEPLWQLDDFLKKFVE
ncbi:MAG: hypothetical protein FH747_09650 [Stenotrophomonas sp.]|jgi:hypothetical protein|uniref:SIR2 family protein n=1 Tax=Stenotrophomonas sp. TaxID=69392 RepID=UPI0013548AE7|nr:SIR2 family protein [Stenotrophomonas sp.]MTI73904.1 hypothetical protein [Stenotrophomonas sp.]